VLFELSRRVGLWAHIYPNECGEKHLLVETGVI
jgi:hypothetical protein